MHESAYLYLGLLLMRFQVSTHDLQNQSALNVYHYFMVGIVLDGKKSKAEDLVGSGGIGMQQQFSCAVLRNNSC